MSLIAPKRRVVCLLVCLVLGLPLIAQTASESDTRESADAGTASPKTDRTDTALQASDAPGGHHGKKASQGIFIDSKPDAIDAFLASRQGKCIVGALSVAIGVALLFTRRIAACGNERFLKSEHMVAKYEAVIRRDALLLFASLALMFGTVYLVWSIFPVQ